MSSTWLIVLSVVLALGAPVAYALMLRVPLVRNHPEGYVLAFAVAVGLAVLALARVDGAGAHQPAADRQRVVQLRRRARAADTDGAPRGRASARLHADRRLRPRRVAGGVP